MPLRAGLIGRVSEDKSGRVRSVAEQQKVNREHCERNDWLEAAGYEDEGSASRFATKSRPDWLRLQGDIEAGHLDVIMMWDPSRGSRDTEDWFAFLRRCREHDVLIYVTTHSRSYDMSNARDWRTLAEDGIDSAYESEKKSRDVKRGLAANRHDGLPHGRAKFGYEHTYEGKPPKLTGQKPVPEKAAVAREIITRVSMSEPMSAILRDLTERKAPSPPKGWNRHQILLLAKSVTYIGKIRLETGELIDAKWPAIVDEDVFWAAQHVLTAPGRKTTRPGKAKYLLSYVMKCGACGEPVSVDPPRNRPKYTMAWHRYKCCQPKAGCASIYMAEADEYVTAEVKLRISQPDWYRHLIVGNDKEIVRARAEAARLRAELDEWAASDISARAYAIREEKLLPLIESAERRAEQLVIPAALRELASPYADTDAISPHADVSDRWDDMHIAARRDVIRLLFPDLRLLPGKGPASERIVIEPAEDPSGQLTA
jgi:DNA invertase Pin-like site-specific DNA recombinase